MSGPLHAASVIIDSEERVLHAIRGGAIQERHLQEHAVDFAIVVIELGADDDDQGSARRDR